LTRPIAADSGAGAYSHGATEPGATELPGPPPRRARALVLSAIYATVT
jgi:hypothetical protein